MKTEKFTAFGWRVDKVTVRAGEKFHSVMKEDTPSSEIINMTLHVSGKITGTHSSKVHKILDRVPGFFNTDLPAVLPKGVVQMHVEEDAEWFCINYRLNNRRFPAVSALYVPANSSRVLSPDSKVFVCCGRGMFNGESLREGLEIIVGGEGGTLFAETDVRGFDFGSEF